MSENEPRREGGEPEKDVPEMPRVPPAEPELPGRMGTPEREVPGIPRPEPEVPRTTARPEAPYGPNTPGV